MSIKVKLEIGFAPSEILKNVSEIISYAKDSLKESGYRDFNVISGEETSCNDVVLLQAPDYPNQTIPPYKALIELNLLQDWTDNPFDNLDDENEIMNHVEGLLLADGYVYLNTISGIRINDQKKNSATDKIETIIEAGYEVSIAGVFYEGYVVVIKGSYGFEGVVEEKEFSGYTSIESGLDKAIDFIKQEKLSFDGIN